MSLSVRYEEAETIINDETSRYDYLLYLLLASRITWFILTKIVNYRRKPAAGKLTAKKNVRFEEEGGNNRDDLTDTDLLQIQHTVMKGKTGLYEN